METTLLVLAFLLAPLQGGVGHYSKDGLAFDYPGAWRLDDGGDAKVQRVTLTPAGTSNIILVFAQREPITTEGQLFGARANVTMPYVTNIANRLGLEQPPPQNDAPCLTAGGRTASGFRMKGVLEGQPTTAEIYTVVLGQRLLHLSHVRADKDEAVSTDAWKTLLDTLKVERPADAPPAGDELGQVVSGGVINGKALKKPQPDYPAMAKANRAQGVVVVQVVVDEKGDVASAVAVSGPPLLRPAGAEAARRAKFEPVKICGQPVKVSGVVTYNFVIR